MRQVRSGGDEGAAGCGEGGAAGKAAAAATVAASDKAQNLVGELWVVCNNQCGIARKCCPSVTAAARACALRFNEREI